MPSKSLTLVAVLVVSVTAPARAQTVLDKPECTKANIASTEEKITKMKDGDPKKTTASSEIAAAKDMLSRNKTEDCQDHLQKAVLQTK